MRGLHTEMQIALKSNEEFSTTDIKGLASEVTRLEVTGIKSNRGASGFTGTGNIESINEHSLVDDIAEKVLDKLRAASLEPQLDR